MAPRWIGFIVFVAVIMAIVGAASQGSSLALDPTGDSTMDPNVQYVLAYTKGWQDLSWGRLAIAIANPRFFGAIFSILVSQHSLQAVFPAGTPWLWIWFIIWVPIIATVVFGILMLFFAILQRIIS